MSSSEFTLQIVRYLKSQLKSFAITIFVSSVNFGKTNHYAYSGVKNYTTLLVTKHPPICKLIKMIQTEESTASIVILRNSIGEPPVEK